jgi:TPR repeat protein
MRRQATNPDRRLHAAAEAGDAHAQFNLGVLYARRLDDSGRPLHGNRTEAVKWLLRAAQQGLSRAQHRLAELYEGGPEGTRNCVKTAFWFQVAMSNLGGAYRQAAQVGYDRVSMRMTPIEIAKAKRAAELWQPTRQDAAVPIGSPK